MHVPLKIAASASPHLDRKFNSTWSRLQEIQLEGEKALKAQLKNRFSEAKVMPLQAVPDRRPWFAAAAAAVTLLLISIWWFSSSPRQTAPPKDLYAQYMEIPDISVTRAPLSDVYAPKWSQTLSLLKDSLFEDAIPMLDTLLQDSSFFASYGGQGVVYLGTALMKGGQHEAALEQFDRVDAENPYSDQISWYRALSYIKLKKVPQAKQALEAIVEKPFHYKRKEAKAILKRYPPN